MKASELNKKLQQNNNGDTTSGKTIKASQLSAAMKANPNLFSSAIKAQQKAEALWEYATDYTLKKTMAAKYGLSGSQKYVVKFNPIAVEGTKNTEEGTRFVTQEQYETIMKARKEIEEAYAKDTVPEKAEIKVKKSKIDWTSFMPKLPNASAPTKNTEVNPQSATANNKWNLKSLEEQRAEAQAWKENQKANISDPDFLGTLLLEGFDDTGVKKIEYDGQTFNNLYSATKYLDNQRRDEIELLATHQPDSKAVAEKMANTKADKNFALHDYKIHNVINGHDSVGTTSVYYKYGFLTDSEKNTYNYLVSKSEEMARNYLELIEGDLEDRATFEFAENLDSYGIVGDAARGMLVGATNLYEGVMDLGLAGVRLNEEYGNDAFRKMAFDSSTAEKLSNAIISGEDGWFSKLAFEAIASTWRQAPAIVAGAFAGGQAYGLITGVQVTSQSMKEAAQSNRPMKSGFVYGLVQTGLEIGLEKIFGGIAAKVGGGTSSKFVAKMISKIDDKVTNKLLSKFLKYGVSLTETASGEFVQEFTQALIDPMVRNIIYEENNIYSTDTLLDAFYQGVVGFLAGGIMAVPSVKASVTNTQFERIGAESNVKNILELCESCGFTDSDSYTKVKKLVESGKQVDNVELGILSVEVTRHIYDNTTFTEAYLQEVANLGSVEQISNLMFGGNIDAARIFKQTYSSSSNYAQIDSPNVILGTAEDYAQVEKARASQPIINTPKTKGNVKSANTETIDGQTQTGYNNIAQNGQGGYTNVETFDNRGFGEGDSQRTKANTGAEGEGRRTRTENERDFIRRITGTSQKSGRRIRNIGKSLFAYTEKETDGSQASRAVEILKSLGIKAVYCEGFTESNVDGVTTQHTEAVTAPDGTIYVSSNSSLSAIQIAAHEAIHYHQKKNTAEYAEFETVICDGLLWGTDEYAAVAKEIFEGYHRSKYKKEKGHNLTDEEVDDIIRSPEYAPDFLIEFTAYVNEAISANSTQAIQMFSKVFSDWNAVVEASRKFNEDIGLDFSSISSDTMTPEENSSETESNVDNSQADDSAPTGGRVLDMPAITVEQQNFVKKIGKALGRNVEFVNMDKFLKEHDVNTEGLKIYPDGAIDSKGNIFIWYNAKKAVQFVFKHELTHFGERSKHYKQFVEFVRNSKIYENWMREKVKTSKSYKEWLNQHPEETGKELRITQVEGFLKQDHIDAQSKTKKFGKDDALAEVIADFVGEKCFGKELTDLNQLIDEANTKRYPKAIQFLADFISYLKKKLAGNKQITFELSRIEDSFRRLISDANNTKTPTEDGRGLKYSIAIDSDGEFVRIDTNQEVFDGKTVREMQDIARKLIRDNFRGKVLSVGEDGKVFISKRSSDEYAYPANRRMEDGLKESKMRAAPELDNLLSVSQFIEHQNDDGRHPQATGGWDVYYTRFEVGGTMFSGEVKIMVTDRGYVFHDITKIKRLPVNGGLTENNSAAASGNPSIDSITDNGTSVNSNSMQENENYSSEKNDLKFSVPTATENKTDTQSIDFTAEFKTLMQSFQNGDISQDEYMRRVSELYQQSIDENGQIPQGEMVDKQNKAVAVPKSVKKGTKIRQHVSRILGKGHATEEQESFFKELILAGDFSYEPTTNDKNIKKATDAIEKEGYQKAKQNWSIATMSGKADADTVAKGEALLQLAFEQNSAVDIVNIAAQLAELGTHIGQGLQAMSLVKRMGGLGQLVYLERCVTRINATLDKKIKKGKAEVVKIDPTLAQQLADSKTEAEFEITYAAIVKDIAAQVPSTFVDKWNALRYVCMLFNPKTHIRNIVGNAVFLPAVRIKDIVTVGIEKGVSKDKRTKVVKVKKTYQEFAEKDFEQVKDIITGTGKYNPSDEIRANQRIFKSTVLEAARKFNFDMLEKEDAIFLKLHYKHALGGYLQAQGINLDNITPKQLTKAREYAMLEAMKATYRDASKASNMIAQFAKTNAVTEIFVEGLLPYKKTPINIIKRGVEYSPVGLIKTLSKGIYDLKQGNIDATQFIDGLASGLTGTGICIIGALLAQLGVIKGSFDDEEKWFRKLNGEQEYSIEIGGMSYTIDWATPWSIPFFLGVAIAEYNADEDADILSSIWDFGMASFEPLLNLSLLSGIEDAIQAVSYADDGQKITSFLGTTMESYFSQFLPTIFGKTANLFDDTRRTTYIDRTSNYPAIIQEAWNKVIAKLPFASQSRAKYVDAWGETEYTGSFIERFFQEFVSPGYASTVNSDDIYQELMRLRNATGESGVFPSTPKKYFTLKGVRRDLSKEEYFDYATFKGQTQADLVDEAIHSEEYAKLTDEQKVKVIKDIYTYSGALAKCQLDYSYDEVAAMQGVDKKGNLILTEEKYKRLNDKARRMLVDEYFMESNGMVKAYKYAKNGKSVVEHFCKKARDN